MQGIFNSANAKFLLVTAYYALRSCSLWLDEVLLGAIANFNQALKLNPNYPAVYRDQGLVRDRLGDKQGAIADLQKATQLFKSQANPAAIDYILLKINLIQR